MKSESETIVSNLLHEVAMAKNLFHNTIIRTVSCTQPFTLDDITSLLIESEIWVTYKKAGGNKYLLRLEWSDY